MILTIPFAELRSSVDDNTEFNHFQRTTAMAVALDYFFRPVTSIGFVKKLDESIDRLGFAGQRNHASFDVFMERIQRQLIVLEQIIRPLMRNLELDDVDDLGKYMIFKVVRCLPQGWMVEFNFTVEGQRYIECVRG